MARITETDINLTEIADEFPSSVGSTVTQGDVAPHQMSEFFGVTAAVPTSGEIKFSDFAGEIGIFQLTVSSNTLNLNVRNVALANGWDGVVPIKLIITPGVYIWSDSITVPALTTGDIDRGLIIENHGYIMGKGGRGFHHPTLSVQDGGDAIELECNVLLDNVGYIGGGGGGGQRGDDYFSDLGGWVTGGGGGAGGGSGGSGNSAGANGYLGGSGGSVGNSGGNGGGLGGAGGSAGGSGGSGYSRKGNDAVGGGGGGGRIMPGTSTNPIHSGAGAGGGPEQTGGGGGVRRSAGGGGWGADGGTSSGQVGGSGGAAIVVNGNTLVITNGEQRIYGAYA